MGANGSCSKRSDETESPHGYAAGTVDDYEDEDKCKEVWITDEFSVLVAKHDDKYYGIGSKCPHYGAPLGKGIYKDGTIKCPWHGACFDFSTGDLEDFPGLDNLPTYQVKVKHGKNVMVYVNPHHIVQKIVKPMVRMKDPYNRIVILGAGPAGFMCAQTLRQEGFDGKITMITKDNYLPYDRPKLSKAPGVTWEDIKLRDPKFYEDHDIEVMLNINIGRMDINGHKLYLESNDYNEFISYDKLVMAHGLKPRMYAPNVKGYDLKNILKCTTLEDSINIGKMIVGKNVVLIGSSFVAMELASSIKDKVASLGIISRQSAPYGIVFGESTGLALLQYFLEKAPKAKFYPIDEVKFFEGNAKDEVTSVVTVKKLVIPCDIVIVAIGAVPNTEMLDKTGIKLHEQDRSIICNKYLETNIKHTYAAGDIANFPLKVGARDRVSIGHWQVALTHGRICALNILERQVSVTSLIPFFWTSLCGVNIRYTGYGESYDETSIYGNPNNMEFCTVYTRFKKVVALCTVGCDPLAAQMASAFEEQDTWEKPIPKFIIERFPDPPVAADLFTGYRPKDDGLCNFDLKRADLKPRLIPEKPPPPSSTNIIQPFQSILDDPLTPTLRDKMIEQRLEQTERRNRRLTENVINHTRSETRMLKWGPFLVQKESTNTTDISQKSNKSIPEQNVPTHIRSTPEPTTNFVDKLQMNINPPTFIQKIPENTNTSPQKLLVTNMNVGLQNKPSRTQLNLPPDKSTKPVPLPKSTLPPNMRNESIGKK